MNHRKTKYLVSNDAYIRISDKDNARKKKNCAKHCFENGAFSHQYYFVRSDFLRCHYEIFIFAVKNPLYSRTEYVKGTEE